MRMCCQARHPRDAHREPDSLARNGTGIRPSLSAEGDGHHIPHSSEDSCGVGIQFRISQVCFPSPGLEKVEGKCCDEFNRRYSNIYTEKHS